MRVIQKTRKYPLVIFAGISQPDDSGRYRPHNFLGKNKAELLVGDEPLLTRALRHYATADAQGIRFGPIYLTGVGSQLEHLIPPEAHTSIVVRDTTSTLGEKLIELKSFGDQLTCVVTGDIVPTLEDICTFLQLVDAAAERTLVAPVINGEDLISLGFRKNKRHRIYPIRNEETGNIEVGAFSQIYAFRPTAAKLDAVGKFADACFRIRNDGLHNFSLLLATASLIREVYPTIPKFLYRLLGSRQQLDERGEYKQGLIPIPTYHQIEEILAEIFYKNVGAKQPVMVKLINAPTLAMDIDDATDLRIVRQLYADRQARSASGNHAS